MRALPIKRANYAAAAAIQYMGPDFNFEGQQSIRQYRKTAARTLATELWLWYQPSKERVVAIPEKPTGTISELWRYPVKSMLGERCEALQTDARGIVGDRLYAVRDATDKLGSGKSTRRFRRIDGLFRFQASYRDQVPHIRFPSGAVVRGDNPSVHEALSEALGQPLALVREAGISHLDVGSEVELLVNAATERCGMVAFAQNELPEAPAVLRQIRQQADLQFGVYAQVVVPGVVSIDDPVVLVNAEES